MNIQKLVDIHASFKAKFASKGLYLADEFDHSEE